MKTKALTLVLAVVFAVNAAGVDITLSDGRVLHNATILSQSDDRVNIADSSGIEQIAKSALPIDLREKYPVKGGKAPFRLEDIPEPKGLDKPGPGEREIHSKDALTGETTRWRIHAILDPGALVLSRRTGDTTTTSSQRDYDFWIKVHDLKNAMEALKKADKWSAESKASRPPAFSKKLAEIDDHLWEFAWSDVTGEVEVQTDRCTLKDDDFANLYKLLMASPHIWLEAAEEKKKADTFSNSLK